MTQTKDGLKTVAEYLQTEDPTQQAERVVDLLTRNDIVIVCQFKPNTNSIEIAALGANLTFDQISELLSGASRQSSAHAERLRMTQEDKQDEQPTF